MNAEPTDGREARTHKYKAEWSSYKVSVQVKASTLFMVDEKRPPVRTAPLDQF